MNNSDPFDTMIDTFAELAKEKAAQLPPLTQDLPTLNSILAETLPLPHEALFLGLAEDHLPVLLNLHDPLPGPILITGDKASGKTKLLQTIAQAADLLHSPAEVQCGIVTPHPDEWNNFQGNQNNVGIYLTGDKNAGELLQSLVTWAHNNKGEQQTILLLVDNLEALTKLDQQVEQNLRWLLLRGPSRRVWPIVTLNASSAETMKTWLDFFRTRLFGYVSDPTDSDLVTGNSTHSLNRLNAGSQFAMLEKNKLVKFLVPTID